MAGLSVCFAIFVVYCSSNFAFGAADGAKANDPVKLDLQVQSVRAVLMGSNIVEALNQVSNRLDKGGPDPRPMTCPECPEPPAIVTCPMCPKPQCPESPNNEKILQIQANITCPECPAEVTPVSCPEPVKCPACSEPTTRSDELTSLPVDCYEHWKRGFVESGIYKIHPLNYSIDVFCDMETDGGGWTVFQRRGDFGEPKQNFYLNWTDYKEGFGDLKREFWLGNDYLFAMTNQKSVRLRIDLEDWEGEKRYATYEYFLVKSEEEEYRVTFGKYTGNAGDSLAYHNNMPFSSKDRGNGYCTQALSSCWWFNFCIKANLNGEYVPEIYSSYERGMIWSTWKGDLYSLKGSEMKFRPILASG